MSTMFGSNKVWAIDRSILETAIREVAAGTAYAAVNRETRAWVRTAPGVAVIPVHGLLTYRNGGPLAELFGGGTSIAELTTAVRKIGRDQSIKEVILDIDSPGGETEGLPELALEIRRVRQAKKVTAIAAPMAASAGYWIGAQATEFLCMSSGQVGSIGVYGTFVDTSEFQKRTGIVTEVISAGKYKAELSPHAPLSDDARSYLQSMVNFVYRSFLLDVAAGRSTSPQAVEKGYGEGRMLFATQAKAAGMVDGIGSVDGAIAAAATAEARFTAEMDIRRRRFAAQH